MRTFLPDALRDWRSARATRRAVAFRNGELVLSEWRQFAHHEACFASAELAEIALKSGAVVWRLVK